MQDGLPVVDPTGPGEVKGALLTFLPERVSDAYDRISAMEPDKHYRWDEAQAGGSAANMLVGRYPKKGSVPCEDADWNGWADPLFTAALEVVLETLMDSLDFNWDLKPLFKLQMAYLLLWSSIERYGSLRYHLGDKVLPLLQAVIEQLGVVDHDPLEHPVELLLVDAVGRSTLPFSLGVAGLI